MTTPVTRPKENVWNYQRPLALERTPLELKVVWQDHGKETVVAETRDGGACWKRCEHHRREMEDTGTYFIHLISHPPTYYIPEKDVDMSLLEKTSRSSFCEVRLALFPSTPLSALSSLLPNLLHPQWKGFAAYFNFLPPSDHPKIINRIWSYPAPTPGTTFEPITNHLSFYASSGGLSGEEGWACFVDGEKVVLQEGDASFGPLLFQPVSQREADLSVLKVLRRMGHVGN